MNIHKYHFVLLPILLAAMYLTSCAVIKPDVFDEGTRFYNNYKYNYSVKLPDDFQFVKKSELKDPYSKSLFSQFPVTTKILYNKHYPVYIIFSAFSQTTKQNYTNFIDNIGMEEYQKEIKEQLMKNFNTSYYTVEDVKIGRIKKFVTVDYTLVSKVADLVESAGITVFLYKGQSMQARFFLTGVFTYPSQKEIAREKYTEFLEGIEFNRFLQEERYQKR